MTLVTTELLVIEFGFIAEPYLKQIHKARGKLNAFQKAEIGRLQKDTDALWYLDQRQVIGDWELGRAETRIIRRLTKVLTPKWNPVNDTSRLRDRRRG